MIYTAEDYLKFSEADRASLTFNRQVRDAIAERVQDAAAGIIGDDDAEEWVEDMCGEGYRNSAHARLKQAFTNRMDEKCNLGLLEALKAVTDRIAELELAAYQSYAMQEVA